MKRSQHIGIALVAIFLAALLYAPFSFNSRPARALPGDLARTPPMGWNTWNRFRCDINEQLVREMADALVNTGMRDLGYQYVIIDDCWQSGRHSNGLISYDSRRFPNGIAALAEYVHARGLKLGLYTDVGRLTCQGKPGSLGYEQQDANTYAAWGVDYVKLDWCFTEGLDARVQYAKWRDALASTGRPMILSICEWGRNAPWEWGPSTGHMWRTTDDIEANWASVLRIIDTSAPYGFAAGPGGWNDLDMLEVGNDGLSDQEGRAHFSMWALMASPLIAGNDLRSMSETTRATLTNPEVIAVNQDPAGIQGMIVDDTATGLQVWSKPLADGSRAVVVLNRSETSGDVPVLWNKLGLPPGIAAVRDLWAHTDLGTFAESATFTLAPHSAMMLKINSVAPGTWLSAMPIGFANNGYGPFELDTSNGETGAGDGRRITINGITYSHGLGVHAPSDLRYYVGGRCTRFSADIGIDDEVGPYGTAVFQVWTDGILRYDSGIVSGVSPPQSIELDITGAYELQLVVTEGGDTTEYDHADWAGAHVQC